MEDNSPHKNFSDVKRQLADDIESQHGHSDSYDIGDNVAPESPDAYPIYSTADQDRLFTVVPTENPDEYIEHEHDPILQPRGAHTKTIQAQYEEAARRAATAGPQTLQVPLFNGNLVLDCPIAPRLLNQIPHAQPPERDEFTHARYSVVTGDPLEFREQGYVLRPLLFAKPRKTELLVAVTMYNEDEILLGRTLNAVVKNVEHLCSRASSQIWGKEAWKKIVICVISDGRNKIHPKSLALLAGLGVYQEGVAKSQVDGKDVVAHLYEYSTQCRVDIKGDRVTIIPRGQVPCQIMFCLKEKNQRRVNSHRWLFQAFSDILDPNICILLDASTVPVNHAFYYLWYTFRRNPACGCAVGEYKTGSGSSLLNPLVASQHFEYKTKSMLDRPLESLFGHRFDSSGALSAYRWTAVRNDRQGDGPLHKYFLTDITISGSNQRTEILNTNMALAEDRILSFELVNKKNCSWKLLYVASAYAEVDVPTYLFEFLLQRRRWLNGNTFASIYSLLNFPRILQTSHSRLRKMALSLQFAYQAVSMSLTWFSIGLFYLTFHIATISLSNESLYGRTGYILAQFFGTIYLLNLLFSFILALGNRPFEAHRLYSGVSYLWTLLMVYMVFALITITVHVSQTPSPTISHLFGTQLFWSLVVPILVTYAIWLVVSMLFFSPWHMFTSIIQYILFLPTSVNLVSVYAFCNIHDVSWGVSGSAVPLGTVSQTRSGIVRIPITDTDTDTDEDYEAQLALLRGERPVNAAPTFNEADAVDRYYRSTRTLIVFSWISSNVILAATIINIPNTNVIEFGPALHTTQGSVVFIAIVLWRFAADAMIKAVGVILYLLLGVWKRR